RAGGPPAATRPDRRGQPPGGQLRPDPRPGPGRPGPGPRAVPPARPAAHRRRPDPVRWRAADGRTGPGADHAAPLPADRRAVPRPGPGRGQPADPGHRRGGRIRHRRAADRAVRHRRARPGPAGAHHGGRPDPLLRPGPRAARAARAPQLRLPPPRQPHRRPHRSPPRRAGYRTGRLIRPPPARATRTTSPSRTSGPSSSIGLPQASRSTPPEFSERGAVHRRRCTAPLSYLLRRPRVRAMINICFAGVTGWTAPPILAAIDAAEDLTLTSGVSRSAAGQGAVYATAAEALAAAPADVLVDFTSAAAVQGNARAAIEAGVHVVIGTSGLTAGDYAEIDRLARDRGVGVIAAGNFSVMAAVLRRAATMAAEHIGAWEIIDYASDTKPDVPSGTARDLAETLGQVREPARAVPLADLEGPAEARGAEIGGTRVHSVRLPGFVVSTEVVFAGPGERLVMRHDPGLTPAPYVAGTLLAVRRVADAVGVRRGLDSLLFGGPA